MSTNPLESLDFSDAQIFHQGAHLTRFKNWLYLSPNSQFAPGQPIRGGIPVIFPWFGPNAQFPDAPAHGFARTAPWNLESQNPNGAVWTLDNTLATSEFWPFSYFARLEFRFGAGLDIRFRVENHDARAFDFEFALHTYFTVSHISQVQIEGLDGKTFLDKTDNGARKIQSGAVKFEGETDRVYLDAGGPIQIVDGEGGFVLENLGGWRSTVVWNPAPAKAARLSDLGADEWPHFVCVESGAIAEDAPHLQPGESFQCAISIRRR